MVQHMFVRVDFTIVLTQDALPLLLVMSLSEFLWLLDGALLHSCGTLKRKSKLTV